jgi:hypothetical protein
MYGMSMSLTMVSKETAPSRATASRRRIIDDPAGQPKHSPVTPDGRSGSLRI